MEPGQLFLKETDIICNVGRAASKLNVTNTGDPSSSRFTFSFL